MIFKASNSPAVERDDEAKVGEADINSDTIVPLDGLLFFLKGSLCPRHDGRNWNEGKRSALTSSLRR